MQFSFAVIGLYFFSSGQLRWYLPKRHASNNLRLVTAEILSWGICCSDVKWVSWRLKSLIILLFVYRFELTAKKSIKLHIAGRNTKAAGGFLLQRTSNIQIIWRQHRRKILWKGMTMNLPSPSILPFAQLTTTLLGYRLSSDGEKWSSIYCVVTVINCLIKPNTCSCEIYRCDSDKNLNGC